MALTADTPLTQILGSKSDAPVAASATIYEGSMLGDSSGYVRPLTAGDLFRGHSLEYIDNSSGSAGDRSVEHLTGRYRLKVTISGVAITDVGKEVYASDDGTYTLTAANNSRVGVIARYVTTSTAIVEFQTHDDSVIYTKTVSITAAEMKALAATQKTLIPAPGADNYIEVLGLTFVLDYGSEVLAEPTAPDDLEVVYGAAGGTSIADVIGDWVIQSADSVTSPAVKDLGVVAATTIVNKAVVLDNTGGEYTGNASGDTVVRVTSTYKIHKAGLA